MRFLVGLAFFGLLAGCAGADYSNSPFIGTWSGTISSPAVTCSDGQIGPLASDLTETFTVSVTQGGMRLAWHLRCADLTGAPNGDHLDGGEADCDNPNWDSDSLAAHLTIGGDTITARAEETLKKGGLTCAIPWTGTFSRQP